MKSASALPFSVAPLIAFVIVCGVAAVASAFPLTGSPGPEAAQLLSVFGGPVLFLAACARGARRGDRGFSFDIALQAALVALCFTVLVLVVTVSGWSRPSCAPGRGYLPFFLQSVPVLALSSALGLLLGRAVGRTRWAVGLGVLLYLVYVGWIALDWFLDPSFRIITHLSLLVEGDLVRGRALSAAAAAFRVSTMLYALAGLLIGTTLFPPVRRVGLSANPKPSPGMWIAGALLAAVGFLVQYQATDALMPEREEMEASYTLERQRGRLIVHADPASIDLRHVDAMLAEGALWLDRLERRMGVTPSEDINIWLHRDERTMAYWTGAEHVHFALPGRRELHISRAAVPHSTLGHELAHILGSEVAGGLFGVPTHWMILPDAGVIEGLAMAVTPELEAPRGMTLRQKAAAMRKAELAPPLKDLFSGGVSFFGFWRHAPSNAYATAGALIEAVAAERGTDALKAIYAQGDLEAGFESREAMEKFVAEHEAALDKMELPAYAVSLIQHRYARPSILDETCDPAGVETALRVRRAAGRGDFEAAERIAKESEGELAAGTLNALAAAAERLGDERRALTYTQAKVTATEGAGRQHVSALHDAGNALWRAGRRPDAIAAWTAIPREALLPHEARLVTAKLTLAEAVMARDEKTNPAVAGLGLLLAAEADDDVGAALAELGAAMATASRDDPAEPLVRYLLARQLVRRGRLDAGLLEALDAWQRRDKLPETFVLELENVIAIAHARRGDGNIAAAGFESLAARATDTALRVQLRDRQARALKVAAATGLATTDIVAGDRSLLGIGKAESW